MLSTLLPEPSQAGPLLDCACGIGTQALGLAQRGYAVEGSDLSPQEVARAAQEAERLELAVPFRVDDMRRLATAPAGHYGAVLCLDNALPHLDNDADVVAALQAMRSRLRPGGVLLVSLRDYAPLLLERPTALPPSFFEDDAGRRIVHQVWDWQDARRYRFHLYLTLQDGAGWRVVHTSGTYRALLLSEAAELASAAGFGAVEVLLPAQTGFYQPILRAVAQ